MKEKFYEAARDGNVEVMKEILRSHPTLDVNWINVREGGTTAFHQACVYNRDDVVSILLAQPAIDVNHKGNTGATPFVSTCFRGYSSCFCLLLRDGRVNVEETDLWGVSPLWSAAFNGDLDIFNWCIACGREMDMRGPVIEAAKARGHTMVANLLERFEGSPEETRHTVRLEIGWYDEVAAEMFALVVFVSDGLLQVTQGDQSSSTPAARFLVIARSLPLELQMVLCYRVAGSAKEVIPGKDREGAIKKLAKWF